MLSIAMDLDRVLLLEYRLKNTIWTEDDWCGEPTYGADRLIGCHSPNIFPTFIFLAGPGRQNVDECYFLPLSSCNVSHIGADKIPLLSVNKDQSGSKVRRCARSDGLSACNCLSISECFLGVGAP